MNISGVVLGSAPSTFNPAAVAITGGTISGVSVVASSLSLNSSGINTQTGTTYTLVAGDNGKIVTLNNAAAITLTVPASLAVGFSCMLIQLGAGQVTVAASGTTLNSNGALVRLNGQFAVGTLVSYTTDVFSLSGNLA